MRNQGECLGLLCERTDIYDIALTIHEKDVQYTQRRGERMSTSNLNIQIDKDINGQGLPSSPKLDNYNKETIEAIEEGRKIAKDSNVKGYHSVDELKKALEL
ncbi:addiction module antitoxin, RelB/DinJ family [Granulicatella adiacens ATCC 49175]|uniref:Addiction module antitoxin, RelB/DinJ family n=2 Tax=Granulicatella adiacens TaxID=46124 RepID=C8NIG3_9LACT|nr:addiction module antitoxin, RelB/DinJ family [Granulicatella adiacens ATCC 49175]